MPINRKEFFGFNTTTNRVLLLLKQNKDKAYSPIEVSKILKIKDKTATAIMSSFAKKKIFLRNSPYYIFNNSNKKTIKQNKKKSIFG